MISNEKFRIALRFGNSPVRQFNTFISLLDYFEGSFLPRPTELHISDRPSISITKFTEKSIVQALQTADGIELEIPDQSLRIGFSPTHSIYLSIRVKEVNIKEQSIDSLKTFVLELIQRSHPLLTFAGFDKINDYIYEKHFEDTIHEDIFLLNWLNYFGKEEFAKRGGEAIFDNPYIKTEKMGEGVLIQVGESPYDAYTPEGEALLVKATKAMPPYKRR